MSQREICRMYILFDKMVEKNASFIERIELQTLYQLYLVDGVDEK